MARTTKSASDWRLIGRPVCATVSQAIAWTSARSSGGENRLPAASPAILDVKVPVRPTLPPALHLPAGQADDSGRVVMAQVRMFVQQEHEPEALDGLHRDGAPPHRVACRLHKIIGKRTRNRLGTTHERPPFRDGLASQIPYTKPASKPRHHLRNGPLRYCPQWKEKPPACTVRLVAVGLSRFTGSGYSFAGRRNPGRPGRAGYHGLPPRAVCRPASDAGRWRRRPRASAPAIPGPEPRAAPGGRVGGRRMGPRPA